MKNEYSIKLYNCNKLNQETLVTLFEKLLENKIYLSSGMFKDFYELSIDAIYLQGHLFKRENHHKLLGLKRIVIAQYQDKPIGVLLHFYNWKNVWHSLPYTIAIYVNPKYRHLGIGITLVRHFLRYTPLKNIYVSGHSKQAIKFWNSVKKKNSKVKFYFA